MIQIGKIKQLLFALLVFSTLYGCATKMPTIKTDKYDTPEIVYFGGVTFLGNDSDIQKQYPYTFNAINSSNAETQAGKDTYQMKIAKIAMTVPKHIKVTTEQATDESSKIPVMVLAIDRERISVNQIDAHDYNIVTQIAGQILTIDMATNGLISSHPVDVTYIDLQHSPTINEAHKINLINEALKAFANDFQKKIADLQIKKTYQKRFGVADIDISAMGAKSKARLEDSGEQIDAYKERVASAFLKSISYTLHVPVLPYKANKAISTMQTRINNKSFEISIPEPDYAVIIGINGYRVSTTKDKDERKVNKALMYSTYAAIDAGTSDIDDPKKIGKSVLNAEFIGADHIKVLKAVTENDIDTWAGLFNSTSALFNELAIAIYDPSSKNINAITSDNADKGAIKKGFKAFSKILDECR